MRRRSSHFRNRGESVSVQPNTFIGGVSTYIPTAQDLATQLGISDSDISYFEINGNDLEVRVDTDYVIPAVVFVPNSGSFYLTHFIDAEGKCKGISTRNFVYLNVCREIYLPEATIIEKYGSVPLLSNGAPRLETLYLPKVVNYGATTSDDGIFEDTGLSRLKIYTSPLMSTINNDGLEGDLAFIQGNGAEILPVQNYSKPQAPTNLVVGDLYATAVQINLNQPTHVNSIDFYEVYVNGQRNSRCRVEDGAYAVGLSPDTSYQIKVVAVDEFYNKSEYSNPITVITESEFTYQNQTPSDVFSFRRIANFRNEAVRIARSSDNTETDILLPVSGFISLSSEVSVGGTLGDWIGTNDGIIKTIYNALSPRNLEFTNTDYKLITGGVLNTINGKPALTGNTLTGNGLEALGLNGGTSLADASIFAVIENYNTENINRAIGFGNYAKDGAGSDKIHWNPAADHTLRFDGGGLTSNSVPASTGPKVRTSFKNGDTYSDYINGVENIAPTVLTGTNIVDDFYVGIHNGQNFAFSEAIIFLTDESENREAIENEINSTYNIF